MSDSPLTPCPVPRRHSAPPSVVDAPDAFVDAMPIDEAGRRSELPSGVPTPGRDAWCEQKKREDDEYDALFEKYSDGEDEESSTSEEDSDGDDKDEDPDVGKNGKPQKRKAAKAANGDGPRKRGDGRQKREGPRAIILDGDGFPLFPGGGQKPLRNCNADEAKAYHEAKAKKDAAGALELEAAEAAFKRTLAEKAWSLAKKAKYVAVVGEVKAWAKDGGAKATAAKWIRCLTSEGKDRLTPSRVRTNYTRTSPGPA